MIEIDEKEDIVIPFDKIGDSNWEENTSDIVESLADVFGEDPSDPIAEKEITDLETRLGTKLPESLKTFYQAFGLAEIGEILQEFSTINWLNKVWETHNFPPEFSDKDQEYLPHLITFSDYIGNGNMICFHNETGEVFLFKQKAENLLIKLFDSVDDYLKGCLVLVQKELAGDADEESVKQWTKETVTDLFGEAIVSKWGY